MASKSRRNRQRMQATQRTDNPAPATSSPNIVKTEKTLAPSRSNQTNAYMDLQSSSYIVNEIKWIGIVAATVIVVLLVLYFVLL
jgi:hypothetical protein